MNKHAFDYSKDMFTIQGQTIIISIIVLHRRRRKEGGGRGTYTHTLNNNDIYYLLYNVISKDYTRRKNE